MKKIMNIFHIMNGKVKLFIFSWPKAIIIILTKTVLKAKENLDLFKKILFIM
jgi:hypothetical protein